MSEKWNVEISPYNLPWRETGEKIYSCTLSLNSALYGGGQRHAAAALSPGKWHGVHFVGDWMAPKAGAKNLAPTDIRFPDRPGRSDSLYRERCPGPQCKRGAFWYFMAILQA